MTRSREPNQQRHGLAGRAGRSIARTMGGVVLGALTLLAGFFVLVWGEARVNIGSAVGRAADLTEGEASDGDPITWTGAFAYTRPADDGVLSGQYGYVRRIVETCAWVEKKASRDQGPRYDKEWIEVVPDSDDFATSGYDNREGPLREAEAFGGGLTIAGRPLHGTPEIAAADTIAPQLTGVEHARFVDKQWAYLATDRRCEAGGAAIGDQRLRFEVLRQGDLVTVFGRKAGAGIGPFRGQLLLARGSRDALVGSIESDRAAVTWTYRASGAILLWIALYLLLGPAIAAVRWIPLLGGLAQGAASLVAMVAAFALMLGFVFLGWGMSFFTRLFGGLVG